MSDFHSLILLPFLRPDSLLPFRRPIQRQQQSEQVGGDNSAALRVSPQTFGKRNMKIPENWPFDQPRNCAVMTMRQVLSGEEPILAVYHDENDHGWQFIGTTNANESDGRVIALHEAIELDPTITEIADIPPGWFASRTEVGEPWNRYKNPRSLSDDPLGLDPGVTPTSLGGALFQTIGRLFRSR